MNVLADIGNIPTIIQQDKSLRVSLPEGAIAGQVFIQYPPDSKNLSTADDLASEQRIYLSKNDQSTGQILVEWADLTQEGLPEITFDTHSLDRNNSNITIGSGHVFADKAANVATQFSVKLQDSLRCEASDQSTRLLSPSPFVVKPQATYARKLKQRAENKEHCSLLTGGCQGPMVQSQKHQVPPPLFGPSVAPG